MRTELRSHSEEETRRLGEALGNLLERGDLILLFGDLGAGKTVLVKGLARGLGVSEEECVVSPSFSLINEYEGRTKLYHVDLYRLEPEDVEALGLWELLEEGVMVVEWAERIPDPPKPRAKVRLEYAGENERIISIEGEKDFLQRLQHLLGHKNGT